MNNQKLGGVDKVVEKQEYEEMIIEVVGNGGRVMVMRRLRRQMGYSECSEGSEEGCITIAFGHLLLSITFTSRHRIYTSVAHICDWG
uniref:Putative homeodomain-like protein n=1 Tax=Tanacetum cinerariifolium TaxID=118510 RepID=A0A6L2LA59_TANCI|nr:putative homeodomain-like protein [Tanacetum cinerariifolium]